MSVILQKLMTGKGLIFGLWMLAGILPLCAQTPDKCLQPGRIEQIRKDLAAGSKAAEDLKLRDELVIASRDFAAANRRATIEYRGDAKVESDYQDLIKKTTSRVCSILNDQGWPTRSAVGQEGVDSFLFLISKALPLSIQLELYSVVVDAFGRNEVERGELVASYIDRLRLATGSRQLFGSQVYVRDGFLVMAPIEQPSRLDERRAEFKMTPILSYERFLEISYRMPLVRAVTEPEKLNGNASGTPANAAISSTAITGGDDDKAVINIDTAFVTVDVVVPDAAQASAAALEKGDFRVFENDKEVAIETFARTDAPFDIVLLLDLSGSTSDKVGLIRKTTRRFIEMKRPTDRVAVVAFHDEQTLVSELESDKEVLLKRIKNIDGRGSSRVWDAVKFGLDMLDQKSEKGRRKAIVLMSDGADNALTYYSRIGSKIGFAGLVDSVQKSSTAIFPIYLDTEGPDPDSKRLYADARRTLKYLADQSAGNMYMARKLDDLTAVYDRVLKDVGTVYTIGFSPDDESTNSKWRRLRVEVPSRPGLKLKHRPGYFTK
jgi:VWFA-related protein